MHFHLPRPIHGWREFIGEVGIIVIGVLIALGAEQVLEEIRWRQQVRAADADIKQEIYGSAVNMGERIALQGCLRGQISKLAAQLNSGGSSWKGLPVALNRAAMLKNGGEGPVLQAAYRPPSRLWLVDRWKATGADGVLSHFPAQRADEYSVLYRDIEQLDQLQSLEASAASKLAYLASDRTLSDGDRATTIASLAEVDRINSLMALASAQALQQLAALRLDFDPRILDKDAREITAYERNLRGSCVQPVRLKLN